MSDVLLEAKNLSIAFGEVRALDDVSIQIAAGEVRCLAGENGSGKSTFVKIISGVYTPDEGQVIIAGQPVTQQDPRAAISAGVQVIYQDLSLFDHLSVAENIAINRMLHEDTKFAKRARMLDIANAQLERMRIELPLEVPVSTLSMANKQLVAIARALAMDAKILFMDEPTTSLTTREVRRLLAIVKELRQSGLAIVFISHKLPEVFSIADTITVFRDGAKVGDFAASDLTPARLSFHMTGREVLYSRFEREAPVTPEEIPVLQVKGLTRRGNYQDVSFALHRGDILGLTGLIGAGRTELALSLFGLNRPDQGDIIIDGAKVRIADPWDAIELGIALVPEDRGKQGLFPRLSIERNVSSSHLSEVLSRFGLLERRKERRLAEDSIQVMGVNNRNINALVGILSGGNQQKVVIGKWIITSPRVLILDSPTVGIDIGSKAEIYENIHALARQGVAVILVSDEPEEIVANCNKIIVMHEGSVIGTFCDEERQAEGFEEKLATTIADPAREEVA